MERYLSQEDRIRRAEEIYQRRNNVNIGKTTTLNLIPKKEYKLLKKIILQITACVGIYFIVFWMQSNTDNISIDSVKYIKNTLAYDIDFSNWINILKKYIAIWRENNEMLENNKIQEEKKQEEKDQDINQMENENQEKIVENQENSNEIETPKEESNMVQDTSSDKTQMQQNAEYIKNNFSLIKPVIGEITSRFGPRNPTTSTVPKYHTGIDIAVNEGTIFIASMDGVVEQVSSEGDYRKSCKNNKWRCNDTLCTL